MGDTLGYMDMVRIRMDEDLLVKVDAVASGLGGNRSLAIRLLVEAGLDALGSAPVIDMVQSTAKRAVRSAPRIRVTEPGEAPHVERPLVVGPPEPPVKVRPAWASQLPTPQEVAADKRARLTGEKP